MTEYQDLIKQGEREHAEDAAVLDQMVIPPHGVEGTFANRTIKGYVVRDASQGAIRLSGGMMIGAGDRLIKGVRAGDHIAVEWIGDGGWGSTWIGLVHNGRWIDEQSDEQYEERMRKRIESLNLEQEEFAKESAETWEAWLSELPEWIKPAADEVHARLGDGMDWGYQLVVYRLAAMYVEIGDSILDKNVFEVKDNAEIDQFASEQGTTGAQHSVALHFAQRHLRGEI